MSILQWFKSSYSDSSGGQCIEVAYDWRRSTYSDSDGGQCVEVAIHPQTIHVRDSKTPDGPILDFPAAAWSTFVAFAVGDR